MIPAYPVVLFFKHFNPILHGGWFFALYLPSKGNPYLQTFCCGCPYEEKNPKT